MKRQHSGVRLIALVPCKTQADKWPEEQRENYNKILAACDEAVIQGDHYTRGCMHQRNRMLVDRAEYLLAVYDGGEDGGTGLSANAELQKQIATYSKTCAVYVECRKAGYSKKFKEVHEADILLHQAAKKYFDGLGLKKLPTVASLRQEYAPMLEEKKKACGEYRQAKAEMHELLTAKSNVDRLLNITEKHPERETEQRNI